MLVGICLCLVVEIAQATPPANKEDQFLPPSFLTLASFDNNAKVHIECEGNAPYPVFDCTLTFLSIHHKTDAEAKQAQADLSQIDKVSDADIAKLKETYSAESIAKMQSRMARATPEQRAYMTEVVAMGKQITAASTRANLKLAMSKFNDMDQDTCGMRISQAKLTFSKAGKHRWVYNPGPEGLCKVVQVGVLEVEHTALWKYTTTSVSADTDGQLCGTLKNSLNKPEVYSWDAPGTVATSCKFLDIGQ
jgi:hypothetical protein